MNAATRIETLAPPAPAGEVVALVAMIERIACDPSVDIEKMDRLLAMKERMLATAAQQAFNAALSLAQAEMDPVVADSRNDQTRSKYASYAALDRAVRPVYTRHGFGISFDTEDAPGELQARVVCDVCHRDGHTRRYRIDMPVDGKGAKGGDVMTRTHAMGSGVSYGMRYLLKMIFNLAIDKDDDGNAAGRTAKSPDRLPKKDSREIYVKLQRDIHNLDDIRELRQWGEDNRERIAVLPQDWQDILRLQWSERLVELRQLGPKAIAADHGEVIWDEDGERPATISHRALMAASMQPLDHTDHNGIPAFCVRKR